MADPIIPGGKDPEETSVGEQIRGFAANLAKGAFIGALLGARFGTWGMAAGLIVGGYKAGADAAEENNKKLQREYEERFRNNIRDALERDATKGGLGAKLHANDLSRNFHHKLEVAHWMTKAQCKSWCVKVGIKDPAEQERVYKALNSQCYKLCHHWNSTKKSADALKNPIK